MRVTGVKTRGNHFQSAESGRLPLAGGCHRSGLECRCGVIRLTPYGADASGSTTASSPNETRYIAPASFLTQIPGPSKGSLDQVIADYMTGGGDASSNDTFELIRVLGSRDPAQAGATKPSDSPTVDSAVADYKRSADYAAGLSLAVSLTQSFNSSVKRLTQGQ